MFPEIRDLPSGQVNGEHYFAPVDWGDTTLFYMPDRIPWMNADNESFDLMEDPRVKGKVGILDSAADSLFLMIRRPPRSTLDRSSAASDVYKRQV